MSGSALPVTLRPRIPGLLCSQEQVLPVGIVTQFGSQASVPLAGLSTTYTHNGKQDAGVVWEMMALQPVVKRATTDRPA
jgi:hypothetical protein